MSGIWVAVKQTTWLSSSSRKHMLKLWKSRPAAPMMITRRLAIDLVNSPSCLGLAHDTNGVRKDPREFLDAEEGRQPAGLVDLAPVHARLGDGLVDERPRLLPPEASVPEDAHDRAAAAGDERDEPRRRRSEE